MKFSLVYTSTADGDIARLDKQIARRILDKMDWFVTQENPLRFAKRLNNSYADYRFRIGDYRVLFDIDNKIIIKMIVVLNVKHRREVYE